MNVFVADEPFAILAESCETAQRASDRKLLAFCEGLTPADLERRKVILDRREAGRFPETIPAILGHLYIHQIHHRGQVHAMLSGTSGRPAPARRIFPRSGPASTPRRAAGAGAAGNLPYKPATSFSFPESRPMSASSTFVPAKYWTAAAIPRRG